MPTRLKTSSRKIDYEEKRYTSKLLAKLRNEILPEAKRKNTSIQTICCTYDTDVFEVRNPLIVNWDSIRSKIKRMGVESFIRIGVSSSIEDWILDDIEGICSYLKLKQIPKSLKGTNGNARLCDLLKKDEACADMMIRRKSVREDELAEDISECYSAICEFDYEHFDRRTRYNEIQNVEDIADDNNTDDIQGLVDLRNWLWRHILFCDGIVEAP